MWDHVARLSLYDVARLSLVAAPLVPPYVAVEVCVCSHHSVLLFDALICLSVMNEAQVEQLCLIAHDHFPAQTSRLSINTIVLNLCDKWRQVIMPNKLKLLAHMHYLKLKDCM